MSQWFTGRKVKVAAAAGLVALLATACAPSPAPVAAPDAGDPYILGINAELSGPIAFYGTTIRDGVQAWADAVNADGGIDGHPIELVILDSAGDASRAATNTAQLATASEVSGIFGNSLSSACTASTPNAERYEVPMACLSVAEPNEWVFSLGPYNPTVAGPALAAALEVSGIDEPRVALAHGNVATSKILAGLVNEQAADAGVELIATEEFELVAADLSATTSRLIAADPDVIIITGTGPNFVTIQKALRAASLDVPLVWIDGTGNLSAIVDMDDDNVYAFAVYQLADADNLEGIASDYVEAITPFLDEVSDATLANGEYAVGYLTALAWGRALEECGFPCSGADLQPILADLTTDAAPMVDGFGYGNELHYPYPNWYLYKVSKGGVYDFVNSYPVEF
ncbi:MAG TPA: ABC transporter substrate-binding protein [Pseudolysinimonas sp.]|nr:ABC transporter substrate-binding protein [Pseudolysinimonas sp.]